MASAPIFTATPKIAIGQVSAANTGRDGSGTIVTIYTAGSSGSKIERIRVQATVATTAGAVRIFIHDGSNYRLFKEIMVTAITPSTSVEAFSDEIDCSSADQVLLLPTGYSVRASTHNAEAINVFVVGGDY